MCHARPTPTLGLLHQAGIYGVLMNVCKFVPEIASPAQHKIEIAGLPNGSVRTPSHGQLSCRAAFKFAHDRDESDAVWSEEKVHVAGHNHIAKYQELIGNALPFDLFEYEVAFSAGQCRRVRAQISGHEKNSVTVRDPS